MPAIEDSEKRTQQTQKTSIITSAAISNQACPGTFEGESVGMILKQAHEDRDKFLLLNTTVALNKTLFGDNKGEVGDPDDNNMSCQSLNLQN